MSVTDDKAGKTGKCPKCQAAFLIPTPEPGSAPPEPPAPPPPPPVQKTVTPVAPPTPAAVEINPCPGCQGKLTVAASSLGVDVSCPYCQTVFKAVRAGASAVPPPAPPRVSPMERTDGTGRPKLRRDDDEDEDDRPSRRSRRRRDDDDDDDDVPAPRRSRSGGGGRRTGMVMIRKIDLVSAMRMGAAFNLTLGILISVILGCQLAVVGGSVPGGGPAGAIMRMGVLMILALPILAAVGGAISGLIYALIYNLWASMIGGLEMELE
jgi:hypothetical protein